MKASYGERKIEQILKENNITYIKEYIIKEIGNKRFDFAIFSKNGELSRLIEYDGEQHFRPSSLMGGEEEYKKRIEYDKMKNQWAIKNDIPLVRISFQYKNNITFKMLFNDDTFLVKA